MNYRTLGRTGVQVSTQCLGAMMFGAVGNRDPGLSEKMVHRALDAGINFIDTADVYSKGESEEIVGRALRGRRDEVVLATKVFNPMGEDRNQRGGSRRWIMRAVEDSLRRLETDWIDLYQLHRHDMTADIEDTLGALTDLVHQGKVRYIGSSTFPAEWIVEAQLASERRRLERLACEQPQYSIFARSVEASVLPTCQRHSMAVIPWSPLAGGWLTGKYRRDEPAPKGSRYSRGWPGMTPMSDEEWAAIAEARYRLVEGLDAIATAAGISLTQLALGFVQAHPAITATIIGPKTMEQLDELLAAADVTLDAGTLDAIDDLVPPGTDVPGTDHYLREGWQQKGNRRR